MLTFHLKAIFNDPDWYAERMDDAVTEDTRQTLVIDLKHLDSEIVEIAIQDLYTENGLHRLQHRSEPILRVAKISYLISYAQNTKSRKTGLTSPFPSCLSPMSLCLIALKVYAQASSAYLVSASHSERIKLYAHCIVIQSTSIPFVRCCAKQSTMRPPAYRNYACST